MSEPLNIRVMFLFGLILLLGLCCGCSGTFEGSGFGDTVQPRLLTFGFYAEDNPAVLSTDYVAAVGTSSPYVVKVSLPSQAQRESLVARFTLADGSKVLVSDHEQVSGTTPNDFTQPVDYYVTDGRTYTRYSVEVGRQSSLQWRALPAVTDHTVYTCVRVVVNPVDHRPYIAYKSRKDALGAEDYRAEVLCLRSAQDEQWSSLGFSEHPVYSSYMDFDITPQGTLYLAYANDDETVHGTAVQRITSEGEWSTLATNLEGAQATYLGLGAAADDCLVTGCVGNTTATYYRTNAVSVWNGEAWQTGLGPCGSMTAYKSAVTAGGGVAYEAVMERTSPYAIHVYRYAEGGWSELEGYPQEGTNAIYAGTFKLTTDADGNLYTLTADDGSGVSAVRIRKYDARQQTWTTVSGNPTPIPATERHTIAAIALSPAGLPFVVYYDQAEQNKPKCIYLDGDTRQWSSPITISEVAVSSLGTMSIDIDASGTGYVAYLDDTNRIRVYCFE